MTKVFTEMTLAELYTEGFRRWNEGSDLMLIPAKRWDEIPVGTEVTSIFGEVKVKQENSDQYSLPDGSENPNYIDLDHRGGTLAFGIYPKGSKRLLAPTPKPW